MNLEMVNCTSRRINHQKMTLMHLLARRRKDLRLNQSKLAEAASSSQKQISCYEKNIQVPSILKFLEICDVLELNVVITKRENKEPLIDIGRSSS